MQQRLGVFAAIVAGMSLVLACGDGGNEGASPTAREPGTQPTVTATTSPTSVLATATATPTREPATLIAYEVFVAESERTKSYPRTNLMAVDIETGSRTLLIDGAGWYIPRWEWSPDGTAIAALLTSVSDADPGAPVSARVDVVSADGENRRTLYEADLGVSPAFAPEGGGKILTFAWSGDSRNLDIIEGRLSASEWYRMPIDGTAAITRLDAGPASGLTFFAADEFYQGLRRVVNTETGGKQSHMVYSADGELAGEIDPPDGFLVGGGGGTWTGDGSTLGLACYRQLPGGINQWAGCLWNQETGVRLIEGAYGVLSPDGEALLAPIEGGAPPSITWDIGVYDIEDGVLQPLTSNGWSLSGTWSSDGHLIGYLSTVDGVPPTPGVAAMQVFVMDATGENAHLLTDETLPVRKFRWQPR